MAILNESSTSKYMLVEPIVPTQFGRSKKLKKRIVPINYQKTCNILDYFETYLEVITYLCLEADLFLTRNNPSNFELRGYAPKSLLQNQKIDCSDIKVKVVPKTNVNQNNQIEFIFDETMFDDYLNLKPLTNPQYQAKKDPWIFQIFNDKKAVTAQQNAVENVVEKVSEPIPQQDVVQQAIIEEIEILSTEALSQKLFKNFQPCEIRTITLSNNNDSSYEMEVIEYSNQGVSSCTVFLVTRDMITSAEFEFLNQLRKFKQLDPNNIISVSDDSFNQVEYIHTVEYTNNSTNQVNNNESLAYGYIDEINIDYIEQIDNTTITPVPLTSEVDVNYTDVNKRNDMVAKFFAIYQPCLVTEISYSKVSGFLYAVNLIKKSKEGYAYPLTMQIPTSAVGEKEKNFFTEFENKLHQDSFIRIDNDCISFVDDNSIEFMADYVEPEETIVIVTKEEETFSNLPSPIIKKKNYDDSYEDDKIWSNLYYMFLPVEDIDDDEDIKFERIPKPLPILTYKQIVNNFFYRTFKNAPENKVLTFAIQNQGRSVVLHQDNIDKPNGKKILFGSQFIEFDPRIRDTIKRCIKKQIRFYNINSQLIGKVFDSQNRLIESRILLSLV